MAKPSDFDKVVEILLQNESKNFVERIFSPERAPYIDNGDGTRSTHRMATAEEDGVHYVYPTILMEDDGTLTQYEGLDAFRQAKSRGELIPFKSQKDAEWFERHWKLIWDRNHKADY